MEKGNFKFSIRKRGVLGKKDLLNAVKSFLSKAKGLELRVINKAIAVLAIILTVFFTFTFLSARMGITDRLKKIEALKKSSGGKEQGFFSGVDLKSMIENITKKSIFSFVNIEEKKEEKEKIVTNLKLVGIIWSDEPQVMIEDTKLGITHLVSEGQAIGAAVIKEISQKGVIIEEDERKWLLE